MWQMVRNRSCKYEKLISRPPWPHTATYVGNRRNLESTFCGGWFSFSHKIWNQACNISQKPKARQCRVIWGMKSSFLCCATESNFHLSLKAILALAQTEKSRSFLKSMGIYQGILNDNFCLIDIQGPCVASIGR